MDKFTLKRKNPKSKVYENIDYIVTVRDTGNFGVAPSRYRDEESDKILYPFYTVIIKNKHTGREVQKRMYQGDPIYFLEEDLISKIEFRDVWDLI